MVRDVTGKHPLYFEAILQLRDVSPAVIDFAEEELVRNRISVPKTEKVKNGWDYYIADSNFTKGLGKKLQQQFGGELVVTSSLYGQKDGKEIYRVTILFREASFKKDDLVEYRGEEYDVKTLGKEIILQAVNEGKKLHVKYREMGKIKKKGISL